MKFHEKVKRRVLELGLNKAKAAREVGLPESTISNYLVKQDSLPRIDIARKIAMALDVPLDWLADDEADFPVPKQDPLTASNLSDSQLMEEVSRRYRQQALRCIQLVETLEKQQWDSLAKQVYGYPLGAKLPAEITMALNLLWQCQALFVFSRTMYDPKVYAELHHTEMPGSDRPKEQLDIEKITERAVKILHGNPYADLIDDYRIATADFTNELGRAAAESRYKTSLERLKKLANS